MTHKDGPKFSGKHGANALADPDATARIKQNADNGQVACAVAFKIAEELNISAAEVGKAIDLLDFKIFKCQLGLFGYQPNKKAVESKAPETPQLEQAIRDVLVDEKLTCRDAWRIAGRFKIPKMTVSGACEALGIKIKPCQLGAF
jgi:hypothetical protein